MDLVLEFLDDSFLDKAYQSTIPLARDNVIRQAASLFVLTIAFITIFYFSVTSLSFYFLYDKEQMKHPKFLKNQIKQEISMSVSTFIPTTLLTIAWFIPEVRGYSKLYSNIDEYGLPYFIFSIFWFLFFTDMCIYWIHRWIHHPLIYAKLHKPHHRWIVPTPFASHAFHFFDGYVQSVPYHLFVFMFPMHKALYLALFFFVNVWTVSIHDGVYVSKDGFLNSSAHHTIHHVYFNYNYGQYFTLWDRIGGTYRAPNKEQFDRQIKFSQSTLKKESTFVEEIMDKNKDMVQETAEYMQQKSAKEE